MVYLYPFTKRCLHNQETVNGVNVFPHVYLCPDAWCGGRKWWQTKRMCLSTRTVPFNAPSDNTIIWADQIINFLSMNGHHINQIDRWQNSCAQRPKEMVAIVVRTARKVVANIDIHQTCKKNCEFQQTKTQKWIRGYPTRRELKIPLQSSCY